MSQKLIGFFIDFSNLYYNMNADYYAETWIFYSNFILQEITTELKAPARTRRNQSNSINEVATRNSSIQLFSGHETTKTSLKGEMEGCVKLSRDRKLRLQPEIPKHPARDIATKEELLRQKEHSRKNLRSRRQMKTM